MLFSDREQIRKEIKQSLTDRCKSFLSNDWLPEDAEGSKTFPVQGFYVEPDWTRTVGKGLKDKHVPMDKLYDIFNIHGQNDRVLAEGN